MLLPLFLSLLTLSTATPLTTATNSTTPRTVLTSRPGSLVCDDPGSMRAKGPKKLDCVNALLGLQGQSIEPISISRHETQVGQSGGCMVSATLAPDAQTDEDMTSLLVIYVAGLSVITACDRPGGTGGKIENGQLRIGDLGDVLVKVEKFEKGVSGVDEGVGAGNGTVMAMV